MKTYKVFSSFSVNDTKRAKKFYAETLSLKVTEDKEWGHLNIETGKDSHVMVYPKDNHEAATYTVFNLVVDDVEKTVDELIKKGVEFEHYEGFNQDEKGISKDWHMAWFTDPSGNIIALMEDKKEE